MFDKGELINYQVVESGIENSNYFLAIEEKDGEREYVLTIMETVDFDELVFFNSLLSHLHHYGLPVAPPERTLDGMTTTIFCGKPTLLTRRLPGMHPLKVTAQHCAVIGKALAEIHTSKPVIKKMRDNPYDIDWMRETSCGLDELDHADKEMAEEVIAGYQDFTRKAGNDCSDNGYAGNNGIPMGIVHGDLFVDNALFEDEKLTGIIDFYHACTDYLVQDIAITVNAWCRREDGSVNTGHLRKLLAGYQSERKLTQAEIEAMPLMLKAGALRFLLTRYLSKTDGNYLKDPAEFSRILTYDVSRDMASIITEAFP
jgi:homoserine kinase type II